MLRLVFKYGHRTSYALEYAYFGGFNCLIVTFVMVGQMVELEERMGFGYAVKAGAERATSPYLLIVQHDRAFLEG